MNAERDRDEQPPNRAFNAARLSAPAPNRDKLLEIFSQLVSEQVILQAARPSDEGYDEIRECVRMLLTGTWSA